MIIEKCKTCNKYNHKKDCIKNKLWCMFGCDDYMREMDRRIFEYNRTVSGDNFDTEVLHEHGKEVYGSGWKN